MKSLVVSLTKRENRDKRIIAWVTKEVEEELKKRSKLLNVPISEIVFTLASKWIAEVPTAALSPDE